MPVVHQRGGEPRASHAAQRRNARGQPFDSTQTKAAACLLTAVRTIAKFDCFLSTAR